MSYLKKSKRVGLLDEWRGLTILLMVAYHALYDVAFIFGAPVPRWILVPAMDYVQPFIACSFLFISGIACRYSHSNLKRGLVTLGLGVGVSVVTLLFMPSQMIWFGVLHFLGSAMILFALLQPLLDRISVAAGIAVSLALFLLTRGLPAGYLGLQGLFTLPLPTGLYRYPWLMPLGFGGSGSDYFPLIPWLFLFFAGAYLGQYFYQGDMPASLYRSRAPKLAAIGRKSLLIYVLHQPLLYGLLWVLFWFLR